MPRYARKRVTKRRAPKRRKTYRKKASSFKTLSRKVAKLSRSVWTSYNLQWSRPAAEFALGPAGVDGTVAEINRPFVYMCPIPVAPSVQVPGGNASPDVNSPAGTFSDNACNSVYPNNEKRIQFLKGRTFITSTNATQSANIRHNGSTMKWRITQAQAQYREYTIMMISPRKDVADQLSLQRSLQYFTGDQRLSQSSNADAPGFNAGLNEGEDYIMLGDQGPQASAVGTTSSVMLNSKSWKTHYKRVITLGHTSVNINGAITLQQNRGSMATDNTGQTATLASGTIKIPKAGSMRYVAKIDDHTVQATELGFSNQSSEDLYYLVIFGKNPVNLSVLDLNPKLSFQVLDSYSVA